MRIGKARYLAPVAALVMVASACSGGGDDENDTEQAQEELAALPAQDLNPAPREDLEDGGDFVWAISGYYEQHNMAHTQGNLADVRRISAAVLPNAFRWDAEGLPEPIAEFVQDAQVSEDGLEVTYELNPDAVWSDGEPITSADYEAQYLTWSGEREGEFELGSTTGYELVEEFVEGDDEYSFTLVFSEPYAEWPSLFSPLYPAEYMEDEELFEEGYFNDYPVTAGPFGDVEFDATTERITVNRNEDWWGEPAKLDRIIFDSMAIDAAPTAFDNGEIDGFYLGYDAAGYELLRDREGNGAYFTRAVNHGHRFVSVNAGSPELEDVRVRQALALGINTNTLAEAALGPIEWPITGQVNRLLRSTQYGFEDNSGELGGYDPDRARELLDEAGWTLEEGAEYRTNEDGDTLTLTWVASDDFTLAQNEADIGREMLAEIGVEVDVQQVPGNALFPEYIVPGNYELATFVLVGSNPYAGDASGNYGGPVSGEGEDADWGNNLSFHSTPEINEMFGELQAATDPDRYAEIANELDAAIWEEVLTIPMFERPGLYVLDETLHNWGEFGLASGYVYEDIGWAAE
ncbi:ABC transporter family substrate-binding protein [Nocardiopsis sp. NPDC050513]|uniref:ABC transporter family substrate-binding protein n=1 Tax=Nocardiopsis sp. NPDC050513 TaxID=3364338 RepID=UPI00378E97E5